MSEATMKWNVPIGTSFHWKVGMPVTMMGERVGSVVRVDPKGDSLYLTIDIDEGLKVGGVDGLSIHVRGVHDE